MDTLVALWRAAARTHGAAPLLRFEGRADELTYGDVDARCRALAAQLAACGAGGGRGVLAVALCGGRDGWDVVALLACVVARAPWCPCDAAGAAVVFGLAAPAAAVARAGDVYALAALEPLRSKCRAIVLPRAGAAQVADDGGVADAAAWPADALYVLRTSGSSGAPKAVVGSAAATAHRLAWQWTAFPWRPGEAALRRTPCVFVRAAQESEIPNFKGSFLGHFPLVSADFWTSDHLSERSRSVDVFSRDARARNTHVEATLNHSCAAQVFVDSVAEMLGAALGGAALYVPATTDLVAAAAAGRCGRLLATPSLLAAFLRVVDGAGGLAAKLPDLALVVASGEALPPWLVAAFRASSRGRARLVNVWGSTECAADACFADVTDHERGDVPVGAPLDGGVDVAIEGGELVVRGAALALGYAGPRGTLVDGGAFGADERGRFVRTGDRGRRCPDTGNLFCLGRLDDVVQVRGVRASLRDLEARWGARRAALVFDSGGGDPSKAALVAFVEAGAAAAARAALGNLEPSLRPSLVLEVDALPRGPTGKVDRRALADRLAPRDACRAAAAAPEGGADAWLAALFDELLPVVAARDDDDFFARGGTSLLAIEACWRANRAFGAELQPRDLAAPLADVARRLAAGQGASPAAAAPAPATRAPDLAAGAAPDPRIWARCASGDPAPRSGPRAAAADDRVRYGLARRWAFPATKCVDAPAAVAEAGGRRVCYVASHARVLYALDVDGGEPLSRGASRRARRPCRRSRSTSTRASSPASASSGRRRARSCSRRRRASSTAARS